MPTAEKAKFFQTGRSQAVRIPAKYRFEGEGYFRHDPQTGDLTITRSQGLEEIFKELDEAQIPHDFLNERNQGMPQKRKAL